jgi:hypothetical protein
MLKIPLSSMRTRLCSTDLANHLAYGIMALRTREERARTEKALRESKQRLQDGIESARTKQIQRCLATMPYQN